MTRVALWALGLALALVPWPAALAERAYLGLLHPAWSAVTSRLVDAAGVSLSALAGGALVVLPLLALLLGGRRARRGALRLWSGAALTLLLLFPLAFGLGYRLAPLSERAGASDAALDAEARRALAAEVLKRLTAAAPSAGSAGLAAPDAVAAAARCVADLAGELHGGTAPALPTRVKRLPPGTLLRFGFAGVVSPWLLEPHVDGGLPPAAALAVTLHELAHTAGFAPEAEAEAVGLVAGLACADERVAYAAALRLASGLAAALPAPERAAYLDAWPPRARHDQRAAALAAARFRSAALAPGVEAAYDLYLRSQGEAAGLGEYDRGTDLALRLLAVGLGGR